MRHSTSLGLVLAASLMLSACSDSPTPPATTSASAEALSSSVAPTAAITNFDILDQAKGLYIGKGAGSGKLPAAYILFDPQCSHCADLWHNAKPLQSDVLVKWIPVGILNRNSLIQAAMLLESSDPVAMMTRNEDEYVANRRPSKATADVKIETIRLVEQNTSLLEKLQASSVPTIVYRNRMTHGPAITKGALSTEQLAVLFGVPADIPVAN